jgi:predicted RND superfamily exporter protein
MERGVSPQIIVLLSLLCSISMVSAESLRVEPNNFDIEIIEGTTLTETLTITNDSNSEVDFLIRTRQISHAGTPLAGG